MAHEMECYQWMRDATKSTGDGRLLVEFYIVREIEIEILNRQEEAYRLQYALNQFCTDVGQPHPIQFVDMSRSDELVFSQQQTDAPAPEEPSALYFIKAGPCVKIGQAKIPEQRLKELQIGSSEKLELLGVIYGKGDEEHVFHQKFRHLRVRGEWFRLAPEIESVIAKHCH